MPQLDLEDRRQLGVLAQILEMELDEAPELLHRAVDALQLLAAPLQGRGHAFLEDLREDLSLALEVQVDGAVGDVGGLGDVADARLVVAVVAEGVDGGTQDPRPLVVLLLLSSGRPQE